MDEQEKPTDPERPRGLEPTEVDLLQLFTGALVFALILSVAAFVAGWPVPALVLGVPVLALLAYRYRPRKGGD